MSDCRCFAQALLPGGHWKRCIRDYGHRERHVWLESYARVGGRPIVVTWEKVRDSRPMVAEVLLPAAYPESASFNDPSGEVGKENEPC